MNRTRLGLAIILFSTTLFSSCAEIRLASWREKEFTLCGSDHSVSADLAAKAKEFCPAGPELIGGHVQQDGAVISRLGRRSSFVTPQTASCYDYRCPTSLAPAVEKTPLN